MESHGDSEGFKHIPIKIYSDDGICNQRLVSPKNTDGSRKTLQQMIAELYPDKNDGVYILVNCYYTILNSNSVCWFLYFSLYLIEVSILPSE